MKIDCVGITYFGINIDWDCGKYWVIIDIQSYMSTQFHKYNFTKEKEE